MKNLYLIRHAKSSWKNADILSDKDRPLNKRGLRDAPFMGKILQNKGIHPDLLLSSPALRAYTTAKIIAEAIQYPQANIQVLADIYEAGTQDIVNIINQLEDQHSSVMLFGHNPTFTHLANLFSPSPIENVPTCGIISINFQVKSWALASPNTAQLLWFEYPKLYLK